MIAATAMCVAAATEASAQQGGEVVLNNQLQLGDVVSGQTLNVEGAQDQVTVSNAATGNSLSGATEGVSIDVGNVQTMNGNVHARTDMALGGDTDGVVNATTQSNGNYLAVGAYGGDLVIDSDQEVGSSEITAANSLPGGTARLTGGASVNVAATANVTALGGTASYISGATHQVSDASVRADNLAETQYIPATAAFTSQAIGNAAASTGQATSGQFIYMGQRSTGDVVSADTSANAGNAWDLTGASVATANQAVIANEGGSVVARTQQENGSHVASTARVTSYDYGVATASAEGTGNAAAVGNNDKYLELDNSQINSGGVEVQASFAGTNGYDVYVAANAAGNSVTGYACADCEATLTATNNQINDGGVSASANTTVYGSNRAVITSSNAVGNAATFYVSRPGGVP
ncbi:holdfast anchor protein HfaD [soil metagenome]